MTGHQYDSEHAEPGSPATFRLECECGQLVITTARTIQRARRKACRVMRHHLGFTRAAGPS